MYVESVMFTVCDFMSNSFFDRSRWLVNSLMHNDPDIEPREPLRTVDPDMVLSVAEADAVKKRRTKREDPKHREYYDMWE